jgi:hypothetical protein
VHDDVVAAVAERYVERLAAAYRGRDAEMNFECDYPTEEQSCD